MTPTAPNGQGSAPPDQIAQFRSDGVTAKTGLRIPFFSDSFARAFGMPETRALNLITEATPVREERPFVPYVGLREVRYSRPGAATGYNYGTGPIRGVFQQPETLGGGLLIVSGTTVYDQAGTSLGTIPGTDLARFAASRNQMVITAGGVAYVSTGGAFAAIASPNLPPVSDVAYLAGRFVYALIGTDTFYWSDIGDATSIGGLYFATAESLPDPNVAIAILNDELVIFGTRSVEFWDLSSDITAPYQPVEGRGFQRGCAARDTVRFADNALFWVGDNRTVYRVGNTPTRISSSSIEDKLRQCANIAACTAWVATFEGHEIYVLNVPGVGTYAYDISRIGVAEGAYGDSYGRGEWAEWSSFGRKVFRGQVACVIGDQCWIGDDTTNDVGLMTTGVYADYGTPIVRVASAFIKVEEGRPLNTSLTLHGVMGVGNPVAPGVNPVAELRWSDDQGRTFSPWQAAPLGAEGAYGVRAVWRRLGAMRAPGRLVEVRVSDPVDAALSHLELNAAFPGA